MQTLELLIITDEPIFSFGLRVQFKKWGFARIAMAEDCGQAIQSIRKSMPSLIILDEKYLKDTEWACLEQDSGFRAIPVILLTTDAAKTGQEAWHPERLRNYTYLNKPCHIADLQDAVESLLHKTLAGV